MKTITRNVLLAMMMFAFLGAVAQKGGGDNPLKKKIQAYNNQMAQAIISSDNEKVLSFYDPNAISLPSYGEMLRGIEAISKHQQESDAMGNKVIAMKLTTKKVTEYGDALVEIGVYAITVTSPKMAQPMSDEGKYINVWVKQKNGTYKIMNDMWNTNVHPMKAMMGGQKKGGDTPNPNSEQAPKLINDQKKTDPPPADIKSGGETKSGGMTKSGSGKK